MIIYNLKNPEWFTYNFGNKNKFKQVTQVGLHTSEGINRKKSLW